MYISYDDSGVSAHGKARMCFGSVVDWLESDEATGVYSEEDLVAMIHVFNNEYNINECVNDGEFSHSGFTICDEENAPQWVKEELGL